MRHRRSRDRQVHRLQRDWASPRCPHLHRDRASPRCPHLHWDGGSPLPRLHRDRGSPHPHLHRERASLAASHHRHRVRAHPSQLPAEARPCHVIRTGRTPGHICTGTGAHHHKLVPSEIEEAVQEVRVPSLRRDATWRVATWHVAAWCNMACRTLKQQCARMSADAPMVGISGNGRDRGWALAGIAQAVARPMGPEGDRPTRADQKDEGEHGRQLEHLRVRARTCVHA